MSMNVSLYRSASGCAAVMRQYDELVSRWPVQPESLTVPTRYGHTHILACGDKHAPPLVLLHGMAINAVMWGVNIETFAQHYRVYAIDVIGDAGKSAPVRPPVTGAAYVLWLLDVFTALGIRRADVIGISLGGMLTLKLALHAPERVGRIVPLTPAGIVLPRMDFMSQVFYAHLFSSDDNLRAFAEMLCSPNSQTRDLMVDYFYPLAKHHQGRRQFVPIFSDADLRRITTPALLLVGEHDMLFSARSMVERVRRHLTGLVDAQIVPNAGHALTSDQKTPFETAAMDFLLNVEATAAAI